MRGKSTVTVIVIQLNVALIRQRSRVTGYEAQSRLRQGLSPLGGASISDDRIPLLISFKQESAHMGQDTVRRLDEYCVLEAI
jgi:hypothetical protein